MTTHSDFMNTKQFDYALSDAVAAEIRKASREAEIRINDGALYALAISTNRLWRLRPDGRAEPASGESAGSLLEHIRHDEALSWAFQPPPQAEPQPATRNGAADLTNMSPAAKLEFANSQPKKPTGGAQ
jgi:hypothetical protein